MGHASWPPSLGIKIFLKILLLKLLTALVLVLSETTSRLYQPRSTFARIFSRTDRRAKSGILRTPIVARRPGFFTQSSREESDDK